MKEFLNLIKKIFEPRYTPYQFKDVITVREEIMADRDDGTIDPLNEGCIHTGEYENVEYERWVKYHKKTNLPKYKLIKK